jgi:protein phosphatase
MMEVFKYSAKGARKNNEDYLLGIELPGGGSLYLLADGMGGYQHGEIASSQACTAIAEYLTGNLDISDIPGSITFALNAANNAIGQSRKVLKEKLGTTIAGVLIENNIANFFWLGDVRIYHFRDNNLLFRSEDHSLVNEMKKQGTVTAVDILRFKNIVTRSLMGESNVDKIPIVPAQILPGDTLLLCSDGLWQNWGVLKLVTPCRDELINILSENERSNEDNYSMIRICV